MPDDLEGFSKDYKEGSQTTGTEAGQLTGGTVDSETAVSADEERDLYGTSKPKRIVIRAKVTNEAEN